MVEVLDDVGIHDEYGRGHYEARVLSDGMVVIYTKFDKRGPDHKVKLTPIQWDRLVAWVEWQRKK